MNLEDYVKQEFADVKQSLTRIEEALSERLDGQETRLRGVEEKSAWAIGALKFLTLACAIYAAISKLFS